MSLRSRFNRWVANHPLWTAAAFLAMTLFLGARLDELYVDTDLESMMPKDHPVFVYNNWVDDYFGIEDPVLILVKTQDVDGIYRPEMLSLVDELTEALSGFDWVNADDIVSLSVLDDIRAEDDMLEVNPLFEEVPQTAEAAAAVRAAVHANRMLHGSVVSLDGSATAIIAPLLPESERLGIFAQLTGLVAGIDARGAEIHIAGQAVVESELGTMSRTDMESLLPFVLLATAAVLWLSLRSVRGVVMPLLVVVSSVVWTLGLMTRVGAYIFPLTSMMPVLLVAIGVADGIHILHRFRHEAARTPDASPADITFRTMENMFGPVLLTSITTALGICALATSSLRPVQSFGIFTAFGVLAAMVFSVTILPAMLALMPLPRDLRAAKASREEADPAGDGNGASNTIDGMAARILVRASALSHRYGNVTLATALTVTALFAIAIPGIVVDGSMLKNFPTDNPVFVANKAFVEAFGGTTSLEVILEADEPDAWKKPENLRAVRDFQRFIEATGDTAPTRSIADFIARMHEVMTPDRPDRLEIPDSSDLIAQYLLLYSMSGEPDDFEDVVDYDYRVANVRIMVASDHSPFGAQMTQRIEDYAEEHFAPLGLKTVVSGSARISVSFVSLITGGQFASLIVGIVLIFAVSAMMFGSALWGALAVVPVILGSIINFGVLSLSGEGLGVTTALTSSMALGIGVDYAIHFVTVFRRRLRRGSSARIAVEETMETAGVAILYNGLVVMAGFLLLAGSSFPANATLGALVSLNMLVCFLATVTVLASLMVRVGR